MVDLGLAKRLKVILQFSNIFIHKSIHHYHYQKARRRTFSLCGTAEYVPPEIILQVFHLQSLLNIVIVIDFVNVIADWTMDIVIVIVIVVKLAPLLRLDMAPKLTSGP